MGSDNAKIVSTLEINSGSGTLLLEGKGDLYVSYKVGSSSLPDQMLFSDGGANQGDLPQGDSEYEVKDAFEIAYDMGDSSVKLSWEWLPS